MPNSHKQWASWGLGSSTKVEAEIFTPPRRDLYVASTTSLPRSSSGSAQSSAQSSSALASPAVSTSSFGGSQLSVASSSSSSFSEGRHPFPRSAGVAPIIPPRSSSAHPHKSTSSPNSASSTSGLYGASGRTLPPPSLSNSSMHYEEILHARHLTAPDPGSSRASTFSDPEHYHYRHHSNISSTSLASSVASNSSSVNSSGIRLAPLVPPRSTSITSSSASASSSVKSASTTSTASTSTPRKRSNSSLSLPFTRASSRPRSIRSVQSLEEQDEPPLRRTFSRQSAQMSMPEGWSVGTTVVEGWGEVPRTELGLLKNETSMDQDSPPTPTGDSRREDSVPPMINEPVPLMAELEQLHFSLVIIQQPQRSRACGFGGKDRRAISPCPIIKLLAFDKNRNLLDPNAVDIHRVVLTIDLWSEDGSSEQNLIIIPSPTAASTVPRSAVIPPRSRHKTSSVRSMDLDDRPAPATDGRSMLARARARAARGNRAMDICEELEIEEADALAEEMRSRALSYKFGDAPDGFPPYPGSEEPAIAGWSPPNETKSPSTTNLFTPDPRIVLPGVASFSSPNELNRSDVSLNLPNLKSSSNRSTPSLWSRRSNPWDRRDSAQSSTWTSSSEGHRDSFDSAWLDGNSGVPPGLRHRPSEQSFRFSAATPLETTFEAPSSPVPADPHEPSSEHPYLARRRTSSQSWLPTEQLDNISLSSPSLAHHAPSAPSNLSSSSLPISLDPPVSNGPQLTRSLAGGLVTNAHRLEDDKGVTGIFFFGHEISVKVEGRYRLRFCCSRVGNTSSIPSSILCETFSEPFEVFSAKQYPGTLEASPLTRAFIAQGIRLPGRRKSAPDNEKDSGDEL